MTLRVSSATTRLPRFCFLLTLLAAPALAGVGVWTAVGPEGGAPLLLATDPSDARIVYATFASGPYAGIETTVMRSEDAGESWTPANQGLEGERVISLAVDPAENTRLFAVAAVQGCESDDPGGVYRSEDAGAHWQLLRTAAQLGGIGCRAGVLALPDQVLVGIRGGVARSTDHGASWQTVLFAPQVIDGFHTLAADPVDGRIYAIGWYGRFASNDGGSTWTVIADPYPAGTPPPVTAFGLAASAPRTLYELGFDSQLWRSPDAGATWEQRAHGRISGDLFAEVLAVDPRDPDTILGAGDAGLLRSRDGGQTFHALRRGLPELAFDRTDFPGVQSIANDANGRFLVGVARGLFRSADHGYHWEVAAMRGVHANEIRHLLPDPRRTSRIFFTSTADLLLTDDSGGTFENLGPTPPGHLRDLALDPFRADRLLALVEQPTASTPSPTRLFESLDAGRHWRLAGSLPVSQAIAVPAPSRLLRIDNDRIYAKTGAGGWRLRLQVVPADDRDFFSFAAFASSPLRPSIVLALGYENVLHIGPFPRLYMSADAGEHWRLLAETGVAAFDPLRPELGYVVVRSGVQSDILKVRFDRPSARRIATLPNHATASALAVDRRDANTIFVATGNAGILVTHDGGRSWQELASGLPQAGKIPVTRLVQDPGYPRRLYATPVSGGLWSLTLP